jgi:hypothetical protein
MPKARTVFAGARADEWEEAGNRWLLQAYCPLAFSFECGPEKQGRKFLQSSVLGHPDKFVR